MSSSLLFEDIFNVKDTDKKFDRVTRIVGKGDNYEMELVLDVNDEIYPIEAGDKVTLGIATTLNLDGQADDGNYNPNLKQSLMDHFDYVMYGKVFRYHEEKSTNTISLYASFGGLLMSMKGDPRNLQHIDLDARIYLLMRKV